MHLEKLRLDLVFFIQIRYSGIGVVLYAWCSCPDLLEVHFISRSEPLHDLKESMEFDDATIALKDHLLDPSDPPF